MTTSLSRLIFWTRTFSYLFFYLIFIKNWQSYKEKFFFAYFGMFAIIFEHVLFKAYGTWYLAWTQTSWQKKNQSLALLCKKSCFQNFIISESNAIKSNNIPMRVCKNIHIIHIIYIYILLLVKKHTKYTL